MTQPILTREGIAHALFSLIQGLPGLVTTSRRLLHWSEVPAEQQPAAFLPEGKQIPKNSPDGNQVIWRYEYSIYLYAYLEDTTKTPASQLNNLLDALEAALNPSQVGPPGFSGSMQVLGDTTGRIRHAWISGAIETDEGVLGSQAIAIVPIEIEVI